MLQIILILAVACVAAYFLATSRKSKVEEVSKETPAPLNPTVDPVQPAPAAVEEIQVKAKVEPIVKVQKVDEVKKPVKKKAAPKKKATK